MHDRSDNSSHGESRENSDNARVAQTPPARSAPADGEQAIFEQTRPLFVWNPHPMWVQSNDGESLLAVNDAACRLYGYERSEMLRMKLRELWEDQIPTAITPGAVHHVGKDGCRLVVELTSCSIDFNHRPALLVTIVDLTRYRQAEAEIIRLNRDLDRRLHELEALLEVIPVGITISHDADLSRVEGNRMMSRLLKLPDTAAFPVDHLSDYPFEVWINGRPVASPEQLPIWQALRQKQVIRDAEMEIRFADGESRKLLSFAAPLLDENHSACGVVSAYIDITQRDAARRAVERAKIEADAARELAESALAQADAARVQSDAANRAKDRFIAMLSHELRTPLTPVLAGLDDLLHRDDLPESVVPTLELMRRNIDLETRLIDDLLDLTRISRGKLRLDRSVVNVHALIDAAVTNVHRQGTPVPMVLRHFDAEQFHINADPARIQQVMSNLLSNAIKFTPADGTITIHTRCEDDWFHIDVTDNGIGIAEGLIPRIFLAFEQATSSPHSGAGLGLGLTICKTLIDLHGGKLRVRSEGVGKGATFSIELQCCEQPVDDVAAPDQPTTVQITEKAHRLLIVDDHVDTSRALARLLTRLGYQVDTADSVRHAIDADRAAAASEPGPYDLIISDIGLPDGTGLDIIRAVRQLRPDAKAIALSGFGMEEDVRRSEEAGFGVHLTKPVRFEQLESAIAQLIGTPESSHS